MAIKKKSSVKKETPSKKRTLPEAAKEVAKVVKDAIQSLPSAPEAADILRRELRGLTPTAKSVRPGESRTIGPENPQRGRLPDITPSTPEIREAKADLKTARAAFEGLKPGPAGTITSNPQWSERRSALDTAMTNLRKAQAESTRGAIVAATPERKLRPGEGRTIQPEDPQSGVADLRSAAGAAVGAVKAGERVAQDALAAVDFPPKQVRPGESRTTAPSRNRPETFNPVISPETASLLQREQAQPAPPVVQPDTRTRLQKAQAGEAPPSQPNLAGLAKGALDKLGVTKFFSGIETGSTGGIIGADMTPAALGPPTAIGSRATGGRFPGESAQLDVPVPQAGASRSFEPDAGAPPLLSCNVRSG